MSEQQIDLQHQANVIRKLTLEEIGKLGVGHVGGSLSICEVLAALYFRLMKIDPHNPGWPERDRLVLSKGHGGPALYAALALKGYFPIELLDTLNRPGTMLPSHCDMRRTVGIDMTTGSLGQGFSAAVGMALAVQMDHLPNTIYTIIGDGESDEGQIWEAAMFAGGRRLDHLIAFTDYNKMQIDGYTQEINPLEPLEDKWRAFGWHVQSIDGHNTDEIVSAVEQAKRAQGKPSMILLNTIKGKGASFSEGKLASHNMKLTEEMWKAAVAELEKEGA
ncbi:transketolase, thiamine pyrophosphate-binding domain protein [Clostridium sp. MSTE9]|uniref:6-deoxy-6-sulfo-D-fructose transketolase subunit SqwG n=1 Tax=Clostridium sp. (strain MSTE9) TaxID=1105031 RepID=SQWG_CLOS9|nr:transketolase [Clostridium sp. MSTE9]J0MXK0.1 RecName: Full=6-deoxy-6-sulfo-D-fructose transketolase subunit SqwG [Clostridium sp. MSTE9]EJF39099.1 transketolase, thiamine pyrophosphate-binding domain protein [Clostridium sp. MSTE9]